MSEFRKFYDARAEQKARGYYEERASLDAEKLELLRNVERGGNEGFVARFFSRESSLLSPLRDKYVTSDFAFPQEPARGERRYRLTALGRAEVARDSDGTATAAANGDLPVPNGTAKRGPEGDRP